MYVYFFSELECKGQLFLVGETFSASIRKENISQFLCLKVPFCLSKYFFPLRILSFY